MVIVMAFTPLAPPGGRSRHWPKPGAEREIARLRHALRRRCERSDEWGHLRLRGAAGDRCGGDRYVVSPPADLREQWSIRQVPLHSFDGLDLRDGTWDCSR